MKDNAVQIGKATSALSPTTRMLFVMLAVLAVLIVIVGVIQPNFFSAYNLQNNGKRLAQLAIFAIGGSLAIISAGIDLSVGSLIGLVGVLLPLLIAESGVPVGEALVLVLVLGAALGLFHGIWIAKLNIQPFIVTLCGLLIYRSLARTITGDMAQGFGIGHEGLRQIAIGTFLHVPIAFFLMAAIAVAVGIFLHGTVWGRHLFALGQNEEAARYSGINVDGLKIVAYTISGLLAGVAGVLLALDTNSVQPSDAGKAYELYGIAAAVLGGCSLRGGQGTVIGVVVGATIMTVLRNLIILAGLSTYVEEALIGAVILAMVTIDELLRQAAERRAGTPGVGGWLLLLCLSLAVFVPLGTIFSLLSNFGRFPEAWGLARIHFWLVIGLTVFSIYAGLGLWMVRPGAVSIAKKYLMAALAYSILGLVMGLSLRHDIRIVLWTAIGSWLYVAVWYLYLNKSRRVKATYGVDAGKRQVPA